MRSIEAEMNQAEGEALERLMNTYTRLTHEFELDNGYAYKSELTGVLKGLGFTEEDFDNVINTNLKGTYFITKIVAKYMLENKIK